MPESVAESSGGARVDVIVVGGGLAGTILGWTLRQRGLRIAIFDDPDRSVCSRVAAGLFNPITGQRLTIAWRVRELLEAGRMVFHDIERATKAELFHARPLVRLFTNPEISHRWIQRREEAARAGLNVSEFSGSPDGRFRSVFGGFEVKDSGYVDTTILIQSVRTSLENNGAWIQAFVGPEDTQTGDAVVTCRGVRADHIVFAEGHLARSNPVLPSLPFKPDKGELLEVRIPDSPPDKIYVSDLFLVPRGQNRWIVGSTHDWSSDSDQPTDSGKVELTEKLGHLLEVPYEIIGHQAGIRPASGDTMPFVGRHPDRPRVWVFNGFGSRSMLLAPACAGYLADAIIDGTAVPGEVDIARFRSRARPKRPFRATRIAQEYISEVLAEGGIAVDATAGNGHDTLWLAKRVGAHGHVVALDIQADAIRATTEKLKNAHLLKRVTLRVAGHENLFRHLPIDSIGRITAIMFNLGHLPQGNRAIRTQPRTTLRALEEALGCLRPGGRITVVLYPGDPAGQAEDRAVKQWIEALPEDRAKVEIRQPPRPPAHAPWVLVLTVPAARLE